MPDTAEPTPPSLRGLRFDHVINDVVDENGAVVVLIPRAATQIDPAIGHKMAAAPEMFEALNKMLRPWDGLSDQEIRRREALGRLDTDMRPLGLHDADDIIAARAALAKSNAMSLHLTSREYAGDQDVCGLCGEPGADKMARFTAGGVYWPGERRPDTDMVHADCEREEQRRAHAALSQDQRDSVIRSASGGNWP